ncbi:MAG: crossover junction endodeoxyribonuclease RuvC [Patescibacteria group bacterium]
MIILGIDPGIERLGWGLIKKTGSGNFLRIDSGVKKTSPSKEKGLRLLEIYNFLDGLINNQKPSLLGIERVFFTTNAKTAITIGEVRGVILTVATKHGLRAIELSPPEIKMTICGYGKATKQNIASMLKLSIILPARKMLDDETDALALAIAAGIIKKYQ